MKRLAVLAALVLACSGSTLAVVGAADAVVLPAAKAVPVAKNGTLVKRHLRAAIKKLPAKRQTPKGYERDKFKSWVDADHDCQDTRAEVLVAESLKKARGGCTIRTGKWLSYYDHKTFTKASALDIDHLVPLAEVWRSGGKAWTAAKREAYANDLGDFRTLVAVSAHTNRSKGDRDPAEWMPDRGRCKYVNQWVAVKIRWGLSADKAERKALKRQAANCANPLIKVRLAKVRKSGGSGGGGGAGTGGGGLDPRFDTCTEAKAHGYGPYYRGVDPEYDWYRDSDSDGIVCE